MVVERRAASCDRRCRERVVWWNRGRSCGQVVVWVEPGDVEDVPSKGRRGRLAAAREWRTRTLDNILVGGGSRFWLVSKGWCGGDLRCRRALQRLTGSRGPINMPPFAI